MSSSTPRLTTTMEGGDGYCLLTVQGEIGYEEAGVFRQGMRKALDAAKPKTIVDLSGVDFMNTPGLAVLVEAMQKVRAQRTRMLLCGVGPRVLAVLEIAKLTRVFEITATREMAISA